MTDEYFDALLKRALEGNLRRELLGLYDGDPDTSALDRRMEKLLRSPAAYAKKAARPWYQKALRAAAIFLLVCSVLVGLSALNPQVRAKYSDLIKTLFTDHNTYKIESDVQTTFPQKVKLGYIPEGYELEMENYDVNGIVLLYQNNIDQVMLVEFLGSTGKLYADNEHYEIYNQDIDGKLVEIYESIDENFSNQLIYYDINREMLVTIDTMESPDVLVEIFINMEY